MTSKNKIPTGNYRKKDGKWYYRLKIPDGLGGWKWTERLGGRLKSEAQAAYKEAWIKIHAENDDCASEYITVKRMIDTWLDEYVDVECRDNTQRSYHSTAKNHILPAIGSHKLADCNTRYLQKFVNSLRGKLAPSSIGHVVGTLKSAFAYGCVTCGFRADNPAQGLKVPKVADAGEEKIHVFEPEQIDAIFSRFPADHQFYVPLQICYHCGTRISEALALRWEDVNLDEDELTVAGTMLDSGIRQSKPKTSYSARTIPFSEHLHLVLAMEWKRQQELKSLIDNYNYQDYVCVKGEHGRPMTNNDMRFFNMFCKERWGSGSTHSMRHTHASMLIAAGVPLEIVSKRLGHSSVVTTSRIYSHATKKSNKLVRDKLNAAL